MNRRIFNRKAGGKDVLILSIIGVVLVIAFIFILFKIVGQSEKHVEKVRKTKVKYDESLAWRPDDELSEKVVLNDLKKKPNRRRVFYKQMKLTEKSFQHIGQMAMLEDLRLTDSIVKDDWLEHLKDLPLRRLDLNGTMVTDACVPYLLQIKALKNLGLADTDFTDKGLKLLSKSETLESINLDRTSISDSGVKGLPRLKNLRSLSVADTSTTSSSLDVIVGIKGLKYLSLKGIKLDIDFVTKLSKLKELKALNISDCQITDKQLEKIGTIKNLKAIRLSINNEITDKCLKSIGKLKQLEFLELTQCPGITNGAVKKFKKQHPRCRVKHSMNVGNIPGGFHFKGLEKEVKILKENLRKEQN